MNRDVSTSKFYTGTRRYPKLFSKTPDGWRLPFGPYSLWQIGLGTAVAVIGSRTSAAWASPGQPVLNFLVLAVAVVVTVFAAKFIPWHTRSPHHLLLGVIRVLWPRTHPAAAPLAHARLWQPSHPIEADPGTPNVPQEVEITTLNSLLSPRPPSPTPVAQRLLSALKETQ